MQLPEPLSTKINDIVSFIKNADEKTRYYIFGGILVVILILDYLILMGPQIARFTKISGEIKSLRTQIELTKSNLLRLTQYREEVRQLNEDIEKGQIKIRSREGVPLILESISRIAGNSGVTIDQIIPNPGGQNEILQNDERKYYSLPINIIGKCDYHDLGRFLNALEKGDILFKVKTFNIISQRGMKTQDVEITLNTIVSDDIEKE